MASKTPKNIFATVKEIDPQDKFMQLTAMMTPGITVSEEFYQREAKVQDNAAIEGARKYRLDPQLLNEATSYFRDLITLELSLSSLQLQFYYGQFEASNNNRVMAILSQKTEQIFPNSPKFVLSTHFTFLGNNYPSKLLEALETLSLFHEQCSPLMTEAQLKDGITMYFRDALTRIDPDSIITKKMRDLNITFEAPLEKQQNRPVDLSYKTGWLIGLTGVLTETGFPHYEKISGACASHSKPVIPFGEISRLVLFPASRIYQICGTLLVPRKMQQALRAPPPQITEAYMLHPQRLVYYRKSDDKNTVSHSVVFLIKTRVFHHEGLPSEVKTYIIQLESQGVTTGEKTETKTEKIGIASLRVHETEFTRSLQHEEPFDELAQKYELTVPNVKLATNDKLKDIPTRETLSKTFAETCGVDSEYVDKISETIST